MARYLPELNLTLALIEHNPVEREYLLALIAGAPGVTLFGAYGSFAEAMPSLLQGLPDMVIADLEVSKADTASYLKQLRTALPHTAVLILSGEKERDHLFQALEAGVSGWLQKPYTADQILRAIVILHEGGAVLSSPVARQILDYFHARGSSVDCLSPREREILDLLGHGLPAAEIAQRLNLSLSTVRTHVRNMLLKLKANSRMEAVAKYLNPQIGGRKTAVQNRNSES
jgi:DNA-binding NarL/FixJ family response regulator